MLKKSLSLLAYLLVIATLGFTIYYFFLKPEVPAHDVSTEKTLSSQPVFETSLNDLNNQPQTLAQYRGKTIVLNFWATWCPPCREEMPELSQLHQEYQAKNVVVIGIAIDEVSLVKEFQKETPVSYPLYASEDAGMTLNYAMGNDKGALPYTVIIDAAGKVVKTHFGRVSKALLEDTLKTML